MKKTYLLASAIIVVMSLWMLSGVFREHHPPGDNNQPSAETAGSVGTAVAIPRVRTRHLKAEHQRVEIVLRGRTEAKRMVDVKAETAGRVVAVPVEKGQQVKAGEILCELAEDGRRVQLSQAQAALAKATIDYDGALRLQKGGLLSATSIAASKSALETARAAVKLAELDVAHMQMRAPFDGFVESRPAEIGALLERSAVCARLLDESSLLATAQASEPEVAKLALDQPVLVDLSNGERIEGKISFIARAADPQTRTYRVEATLTTNGVTVRDGITASITVPLQEVSAHRITPAVLALDDAGRVGVRIINASKVVEFHHIDIVRESSDGIWVTGLPDDVDLITVGQELVSDGDRVDATPDNSDAYRPGSTTGTGKKQ